MEALKARVLEARAEGKPLRIEGGGSKAFLGRPVEGEALSLKEHTGIVRYEPRELVLTARAGTPLAEIEAVLAEKDQCLGFEPPHFGPATLGGTLSCGLSGPARPYRGAARDFVLGVKVLNGKGEVLRFGGEVIKNVAGFDLSRLMVGAMGTLGVILEASLKVLPRPPFGLTLRQEMGIPEAIEQMNRLASTSLPLTGSFHDGTCLYLRLEGMERAVKAVASRLGGERVGGALWEEVREHRHPFFSHTPLWLLSLPPAAPHLDLPGRWFIEWGGARRWFIPAGEGDPQRAAQALGGYGALWGEPLPLPKALLPIHRRLKEAFDPQHILNRGKL